MRKTQEGSFHVFNQDGSDFVMDVKTSKDSGTIDLIIGEEASRLRIFPINEKSVLVIHISVHWKAMNNEYWDKHKAAVDKDFLFAKEFIENRQLCITLAFQKPLIYNTF